MLAETFPLAIGGAAMAIATLFNWLAAFVISLAFPSFVASTGIGSAFIVFAVIGVVVFPIVWRMVPETKERSLETLEAAFRNSTQIRLTSALRTPEGQHNRQLRPRMVRA
ncbi:MAG: MFS transporter [Actinomycetota bacterium]|nr:MFS transporter [Actinomycetota bacterium]